MSVKSDRTKARRNPAIRAIGSAAIAMTLLLCGCVERAELRDGSASGVLAIEPGILDFGNVGVGQSSADVSVNARAIGGAAGTLSVATEGGAFVVVDDGCSGLPLPEGQQCGLTLRFEPVATGPASGTITVAAPPSAATTTLAGAGVDALTVTPGAHDFGPVTVDQTVTHDFTVTHFGTADTGPLTAKLDGPAVFSIDATGCTVLAPNESCPVRIAYSPLSEVEDVASLIVGDGNLQAQSSITGNGTPPEHLLNVSKTGGGSGTVISTPAGIDCGSQCSASFPQGTSVTLTATPPADAFAGWGEACTDHDPCNLIMDQAKSVLARFHDCSACVGSHANCTEACIPHGYSNGYCFVDGSTDPTDCCSCW